MPRHHPLNQLGFWGNHHPLWVVKNKLIFILRMFFFYFVLSFKVLGFLIPDATTTSSRSSMH
jgi:hypothetical protein